MNNTNEHTSSLSGVKRSSEKDQEVLQDAETAEPVQKQLKLDHKPAANSAPSQITPVATAPMTTPLSQQGKLGDDVNIFVLPLNSLTNHPIPNETNSKEKQMSRMKSRGSCYLLPFSFIVITQLK